MLAHYAFGLGDIVRLTSTVDDGYRDCTVNQFNADGTVNLFRPYVHTSDFSYAGKGEGSMQVICYLGFEEINNISTSKLTLIKKSSPIR